MMTSNKSSIKCLICGSTIFNNDYLDEAAMLELSRVHQIVNHPERVQAEDDVDESIN